MSLFQDFRSNYRLQLNNNEEEWALTTLMPK